MPRSKIIIRVILRLLLKSVQSPWSSKWIGHVDRSWLFSWRHLHLLSGRFDQRFWFEFLSRRQLWHWMHVGRWHAEGIIRVSSLRNLIVLELVGHHLTTVKSSCTLEEGVRSFWGIKIFFFLFLNFRQTVVVVRWDLFIGTLHDPLCWHLPDS